MKLYRKIARALGYEVVRRRLQPTPQGHIIDLLAHCDIDLVLDVGANRGQFGHLLREEGFGGDIHSFEPVAATFTELSENCRNDPRWFPHNLALGDAAGTQTIQVSAASDLSSLLQPNEFGRQEFADIRVSHGEQVAVSTVDEFLRTEVADSGQRRIFLKMDTQGYDLRVFAGAQASLPRIFCLLSEISLVPIYDGMPHYSESLQRYEEQGFAISGLYPVSRKADLSVIEMDCILINTSAQP